MKLYCGVVVVVDVVVVIDVVKVVECCTLLLIKLLSPCILI